MARAKRGDSNAFDDLVRKYRPRVYALALHLTGQESDADDITQDAFLRAYSKIHDFEGRSEFFTWLYRIALHRASVELEYYARANWTDLAPAMIQTLVVESFENSGKIVAVGRFSA